MKRLICGHPFVHVATLDPERDESGKIREFDPKGPDARSLSDAPFCKLGFPTQHAYSGVYAITVADRVVYVGKTNNLSRRFGPGEYGSIVVPEPGNPQVTNRRVNHGILEAARRGDIVEVWFHQTFNRDVVEETLIGRLDLLWNRQGLQESAPVTIPRSGKARWPSALRAAESAKTALLTDRLQGESMFSEVLAVYPNDGMVYMKRAEAYEQMGDRAAAAADFAKAERLVPFPGRKAEARAGIRRTRDAG